MGHVINGEKLVFTIVVIVARMAKNREKPFAIFAFMEKMAKLHGEKGKQLSPFRHNDEKWQEWRKYLCHLILRHNSDNGKQKF